MAIILFILLLTNNAINFCFAQDISASQIQRSQEILEQEEAMLKKLEQQEKSLIKRIVVKGIKSLTQDKIKGIILPFQKKWLSKEDILQILDLIKQAYNQLNKISPEISYQIKKYALEIKIEEIR